MKLLYFAWFREKAGVSQEQADPPDSVTTVALLVDWLKSRGDGYAEAFNDASVIRVAVNQEYASMDHAIGPEDEVAFFPPMTGG